MVALWLVGSSHQGYAHHDTYAPKRLAQADSRKESLEPKSAQSTETTSDASNIDRQVAFFEYEMLMHLALKAPAPSQQAAIDLGFADHQFVEGSPGGPSLK